MQLTKSLAQLIQDSHDAGFTVEHTQSSVDIYKLDMRSKQGSRKIKQGITINNDKTAYRTDIRLDLAAKINTQREMRAILGI